jgi:hypothetical protein
LGFTGRARRYENRSRANLRFSGRGRESPQGLKPLRVRLRSARLRPCPDEKSKEPALREGLRVNPPGIHETARALRQTSRSQSARLGGVSAGTACCAPTVDWCDEHEGSGRGTSGHRKVATHKHCAGLVRRFRRRCVRRGRFSRLERYRRFAQASTYEQRRAVLTDSGSTFPDGDSDVFSQD